MLARRPQAAKTVGRGENRILPAVGRSSMLSAQSYGSGCRRRDSLRYIMGKATPRAQGEMWGRMVEVKESVEGREEEQRGGRAGGGDRTIPE